MPFCVAKFSCNRCTKPHFSRHDHSHVSGRAVQDRAWPVNGAPWPSTCPSVLVTPSLTLFMRAFAAVAADLHRPPEHCRYITIHPQPCVIQSAEVPCVMAHSACKGLRVDRACVWQRFGPRRQQAAAFTHGVQHAHRCHHTESRRQSHRVRRQCSAFRGAVE